MPGVRTDDGNFASRLAHVSKSAEAVQTLDEQLLVGYIAGLVAE